MASIGIRDIIRFSTIDSTAWSIELVSHHNSDHCLLANVANADVENDRFGTATYEARRSILNLLTVKRRHEQGLF